MAPAERVGRAAQLLPTLGRVREEVVRDAVVGQAQGLPAVVEAVRDPETLWEEQYLAEVWGGLDPGEEWDPLETVWGEQFLDPGGEWGVRGTEWDPRETVWGEQFLDLEGEWGVRETVWVGRGLEVAGVVEGQSILAVEQFPAGVWGARGPEGEWVAL